MSTTPDLAEVIRSEQRKTRRLLVVLLLGVPAVALAVWGAAVLIGSYRPAAPADTTPAGFTSSTSCQDYLSAGSKPEPNLASEFVAAHPPADGLAVTNFCTSQPDATLGDALVAQNVTP